jgi:hypothetical protein
MMTWLMADVPGKTGRPIAISPQMQPTLHMSIAVV